MSEDPQLAAIRAKRMETLEKRNRSNVPQSMEEAKAQEMQKKEQEEFRQSILAQILLPEAKARLARIAIVKADKARGVEDLIIQMAQQRQLQGLVGESQLIQLLEKIGENEDKARTKVTIKRRTYFDDDDDADDDDDF